jgi:AraC family transcriptional regulator
MHGVGLHSNSSVETVACHLEAVERVVSAMRHRLDATMRGDEECDFSLEDMAAVAVMSPYHFDRVFAQVTGIPPRRFLSALRVEAARRLLLTTKLSVTDVCFGLGYSSLGTFIRRFTHLLGVSPRRLRWFARSSVEITVDAPTMPLGSAKELSGVCGQIAAPEHFEGLIFVGLFDTPVPQVGPTACCVIETPGCYRITQVPDGRFYLFALGVASGGDPRNYFLCEGALRAGGHGIRVVNGRAIEGSTNLSLRPPNPVDPPVLLTLPFLIARCRPRSESVRDSQFRHRLEFREE